MKTIILLLALLTTTFIQAEERLSSDWLHLRSTSLPSTCKDGDNRRSGDQLYICSSNAWYASVDTFNDQTIDGVKTHEREIIFKSVAEPSSPSAGYVTAYFSGDQLYIKNSAGVATPILGTSNIVGTTNQITASVSGGDVTLSTPQDIDTAADVTLNSATLSELSPDQVVVTNGSSKLISSAVTATELAYLSGKSHVPQATGVADQIAIFDGVNSLTAIGAMTDGQLIIGGTGFSPARATLSATANQTTVTNGANSITLGTVQDINTSSSPTFNNLSTSGSIYSSGTVYTDGSFVGSGGGNTVISNTADDNYTYLWGGSGSTPANGASMLISGVNTTRGGGVEIILGSGSGALYGDSSFVLSAPDTSTHILDIDGFSYLSQFNGALQVNEEFDVVSTTEPSHPFPDMTTAQRNATSPNTGDAINNTDDNQFQRYNGTDWAALGGGAGGGINFLEDGSFETSIANVTMNTGSGIASNSTVVMHKSKSLYFDTGSGSGLDVEQCVSDTNGSWNNMNLEVSCHVKSDIPDLQICSSNDFTDILCTDYDGTDIFKKVSSSLTVNATGSGSGTACWRLTNTGTGTGDGYLDECTIKPLEFAEEAAVGGWTAFTSDIDAVTSDPTKGTTSIDEARWRRVGDSMEIIWNYRQTGAGATGTGIYKFKIPSGYEIDTSKMSVGTDGSIYAGDAVVLDSGDGTSATIYPGKVLPYDSTSLSIAFWDQSGGAVQTGRIIWNSGNAGNFNDSSLAINLKATVPIANWSSSTQFLTQNYDWYVDASISGASPDLGTSDLTDYTAIDNGSLTLTNNTSFNNVAIACVDGEEATIGDTTCSGNENVGITFNGWVGKVKACVSFGHYRVVDDNEDAAVIFQVNQTLNDDSEIANVVALGGERLQNNAANVSADDVIIGNQVKVCGVFSVNGKSTVRLVYEQQITGSPTNVIVGDGSTDYGQRDIHWSVIPISGTMYATLGDVVKSPGSGANTPIIQSANLDCDGGSSVTSQTGAWVSSIANISSSSCAVTLTSGEFSTLHACQISGNDAGMITRVLINSTTSVTVYAYDNAGGSLSDFDVYLTCHGYK